VQDKFLRGLDASLIVADSTSTFWLMGNGDVLEAESDGVIGIGSGADFAESAARALLQLQRDLHQQQQQQQEEGAGAASQDAGVVTEGTVLSAEGAQLTAAAGVGTAAAGAVPAAAAGAGAGAGEGGVPEALRPVLDMSLFDIATAAMTIAANSCVYTNSNFSWQHIKPDGSIESGDSSSSGSGSSTAAAAAMQYG
jgi:ATP-dependent protease HslVU (ClpYQ) peptidase subunit